MATIDAEGMKIEVLTESEGEELLDQAARRYLGITGTDFTRAWDSGEFDKDPDRPEIMRVAMLLPLAR